MRSSMILAAIGLGIFASVSLNPKQAHAQHHEGGASPPLTTAESPPTPSPDSTTNSNDETDPIAGDPRYGWLTPISIKDGLPPLFSKLTALSEQEKQHRAKQREYEKQIRDIRKRHLGKIKLQRLRDDGMKQLAEFTDAAAFVPMARELANEPDEVRLWLLNHFAAQGEHGQAALAWVVLYDKDTAIRNEALRRLTMPASQPLLHVVDSGLRSRNTDVVNAAAIVVNVLDIVQAIPLLIFAQARDGGQQTPSEGGDLAWIAIQTQHHYVAGLVPVVGDGVGAFQPIIGRVAEGSVLRVVDAVVVEYRSVVHYSLVNLTTRDWGQSTAGMGMNVQAWWDWFDHVYIPFKQAQLKAQASTIPMPGDAAP